MEKKNELLEVTKEIVIAAFTRALGIFFTEVGAGMTNAALKNVSSFKDSENS